MKRRINLQVWIAALGVALCATVGAGAQVAGGAYKSNQTSMAGNIQTTNDMTSASSVSRSSVSDLLPESAVRDFVATYHIPIVQRIKPMAARPIDSAPPTARLRDLQQLAVNGHVTWAKVYRVSPAGPSEPVTTYEDARRMVDHDTKVDLNGSDIPASSAIRAIARADGAVIRFTVAPSASTLDLALLNTTIPQAMATIAQRTHTHWQAVYVLAPIAGETPTPSRVAFAARQPLNQQQYEETQLFNGPISVQFPVPPPPVTAPPVTAPPVITNNTGNGAAPGAPAVAPGPNTYDAQNPYNTGYGPYGPYALGANPYGPYGAYGPYSPYAMQMAQPYSLSPGLMVDPIGGPYGGSTVIFGGGSTTPQ